MKQIIFLQFFITLLSCTLIISSDAELTEIDILQKKLLDLQIVTKKALSGFDSIEMQVATYKYALHVYEQKIVQNNSAIAEAQKVARKAYSSKKYKTSELGRQAMKAYQASNKGKISNRTRQQRYRKQIAFFKAFDKIYDGQN